MQQTKRKWKKEKWKDKVKYNNDFEIYKVLPGFHNVFETGTYLPLNTCTLSRLSIKPSL